MADKVEGLLVLTFRSILVQGQVSANYCWVKKRLTVDCRRSTAEFFLKFVFWNFLKRFSEEFLNLKVLVDRTISCEAIKVQ